MDAEDELDDDLLGAMDLDFLADQSTVQPKQEPKDEAVHIPDKFEFPFDPYDIQVGFMRSLYQTLEQGKIGIFESPTGTVSLLKNS